MNQQSELGNVGGSAERLVPLIAGSARSIIEMAEDLEQCHAWAARLSATYIAFFTRGRSPWRKRMGRRK